MKKLIAVLLAIFLCGCASQSKYVEGTSVQVGAYIPWQSNLYGVEICSYVSGCVFRSASNEVLKLERDYVATNSYFWGMVETREYTKTKIETKLEAKKKD